MRKPVSAAPAAVAAALVLLLGLAPPAFATAGDLDASFGEGGRVTTGFGVRADGRAIAIQPDGRSSLSGRLAQGQFGSETSRSLDTF
jgi:hypothetical protein